jgi:hypothetical protein
VNVDPRDCVIAIIARKAAVAPEQVSLDSRLLHDLHIDGDDAVDAILEIANRCAVDVSEFDASLYFRTEPSLLSLLPFLPSARDTRVDQKRPLSVGELVEAARQGKLTDRT